MHMVELLPMLGHARILRQWTGLCDVSPDYAPIMGLTEADGFLIDAGWGTYGFKASPIVGKTMAELAATGRTPALIEARSGWPASTRTSSSPSAAPPPYPTDRREPEGDPVEVEPRDRPGSHPSADHGHRPRDRPRGRRGRPLRQYKAKVSLDAIGRLADVPDAKIVCVSAISADEGRRGQDDDVRLADPGAGSDRQAADAVPARAVARADLRHQGRRRRRRADAGRADGGPEPALHRRLPRDRCGEQHAGGVRRPAPLLRQRAAGSTRTG